MYRDQKFKQINLLIDRLERLSADSIWSHRASGIRGSLLDCLEEYKGSYSKEASAKLDSLLDQGYYILEQAIKISLIKKRIKIENSRIANKFCKQFP